MTARPRDVVTCNLCGSIWTAPKGLSSSSYHRHFLELHATDLQAEWVTA